MSIIADLHLHSKYSRAVSPRMELPVMASWASKKGINLLATGDWLHPVWYKSLKQELKETAPGIFELKNPPLDQQHPVFFLLSTEAANIFSQGGQLRRVHNLLFSPGFDACDKIIKSLEGRGAKLMSDGRPVLGIPQKDFLNIALSASADCMLIPAHAWTPWFGQYGSKSGFDSIDEAYGDMAKYIYGIETGLSSDPVMNWQIKELEGRSILSFSDAHSAPKMGREATVFVNKNGISNSQLPITNEFSYKDIADAIKQDPNAKYKIGFTIEFFPEEGKYHYTGHRSCGIKYSVKETLEKGKTCPVCGNMLTIGVEHRIYDLTHKTLEAENLEYKTSKVGTTFVYHKSDPRPPYVSMIPLLEVAHELEGGSATAAAREYERLTQTVGTEFDILLKKPLAEIEQGGGQRLRLAIEKVRSRNISIDPGYDGVFGHVSIFGNEKKEATPEEIISAEQATLF